MRTTTNTGSEQGQRIGHFRSSPPRTIKTASRLRSSPEVERFTVLCASYSVVLDNRLRSWDANERSIFNLPLLLIPEITNLRIISKKRLFSIFRVLCSYIYKDGSFCNDFKKKLWIFYIILPPSPRGSRKRSPAKFSIEPSDGSAVFLPRLVQEYTISRITLTVLDLSPRIILRRGLTVWLRCDETKSRLRRAKKRRVGTKILWKNKR